MANKTRPESGKKGQKFRCENNVQEFDKTYGVSRIEACLNIADFQHRRVGGFGSPRNPIFELSYYGKKKRNLVCMKPDLDDSTVRRNPKVFECVSAMLREASKHKGSQVILATVNLSDKIVLRIHGVTKPPAKALVSTLQARGVSEPTLVVLESGEQKHLSHAHIVILLTPSDERAKLVRLDELRTIFRSYSSSPSGVAIQSHYDEASPLIGGLKDMYEIEMNCMYGSTLIGEAPASLEESLEHPYWANTWLKAKSKFVFVDGERQRVDCIYRRLPINLGVADYLSKEITSVSEQTRRVAYINMRSLKGSERIRFNTLNKL